MEKKEFYNRFTEKLTQILIEQCTLKGFLDGQLFPVEELEEKWNEIAPEYMVDAVPEIQQYTTVAVAWAAYLGMGMAALWDTAWDKYKDNSELYQVFRAPRGFDCMDEYVIEEMLSLKHEFEEAVKLETILRGCAETAVTLIRRENIEPQSLDAFHIFAQTVKVFFILGVSIELKLLGYKYEKMKINIPGVN